MITIPQSITKQGNYKSEIKIHKEQLENWIKTTAEKKKWAENPLYKDVEFSAHFFFSDYNKTQNS